MNDNTQNKLDQATSARLGKLASKPVDTSHLAEHLQTLMRDVVQQDEPQTLRIPTWMRWRPMSAAAMILITVMLGLLVMQNTTQPVIAAPAGLAQIYHEVSGDMAEQMKVTSVEQANAMLAAQATQKATDIMLKLNSLDRARPPYTQRPECYSKVSLFNTCLAGLVFTGHAKQHK